jgi:TM2 domain-containing membrane protein YozV
MADTAAAPKTKLVAGLLGIFLGSIGVHKFYLGDSKAGIIRIVVTVVTFGIGGIWGFIEGIMLLVNGGKDVNGVDLV